jgi:hypothetical protein
MIAKYKVSKVICKDEKDNLYEWEFKDVESRLDTLANYWGEQKQIKRFEIDE